MNQSINNEKIAQNSTDENFNEENSINQELVMQETGKNSIRIQSKENSWSLSTIEILIGSILGVMGGFISGLIPFSLLIKTWYPFVGGTQLISGHHILWMLIAYGLTKKITVIPLTAIIKGFINFLLGAQWGAFEILITLYEGFFLILGILLIKLIKEDDTYIGWGLAGGIGNAAQVPLFWLMTGKIFILHWTLFTMALMFGFLSGVLIAGILGLVITKFIRDTKIFDS